MLTVRGSLLGLLIFVMLDVVYIFFRYRIIQSAAPAGPPGSFGIDVGALAQWTIGDPMFWVVLIVCCSAGSFLVRYWQR